VNITAGSGTVTSVGVNAGFGISATISGSPTVNPTINITNTAPDVVVGIAGGATIGVSGFYPNFTLRTNVSTPQRLLGRFTAGAGAYEEITISTGLSLSGSGVLTATGTTTPYTANNGLTESPANNFQLGGTLVQNTNLTNSSFYLRFTQSAGKALELYSNDAEALLAQRANNSRNTVDTVARLVRRSTTNPLGIWTQSGFGAALDFDLMMSNGATVTAGSIAAKWNSPISPSESSNLTFSTRNAGTLAIQMGLSSTGQLTLDKYTGSTFDGTATKALGVDASGNVITFTSSPVSGDSISPFLLMGG
jgi:hypothetical protein